MQKNVVISGDKLVNDLGTGRAYINLFVSTELSVDENNAVTEQLIAGQQLTLEEPITRARIIDLAVRENYPNGASEAVIRKGVVNNKDPEFIEFNNFIKNVKRQVDEKL